MTLRERMLRLLEDVMPSGGPIDPQRGSWFASANDARDLPRWKMQKAINPLKLLRAMPKKKRRRLREVSLGTMAPKAARGGGRSTPNAGSFYPFIGMPGSRDALLKELLRLRGVAHRRKILKTSIPVPIDGTHR